jgi:uncharacterized protein
MRRSLYILIFTLFSVPAAMAADSAGNKFTIRMASGALNGTEEYSIEKKADGFVLTGKTHLQQGPRTIEFAHKTTLAGDWSLVRYELQVNADGQAQSVEAWRNGGQIQMKASGGGQSMDKQALFTPSTVVLDNLVVGQYAVLVEQVLRAPGERLAVLVPQRLASLNLSPVAAGEEAATLAGKALRVRKYTMELGSLPVEFWIEPASHELMRVSVPLQQIEMTREGFELTKKEAPVREKAAACVEREFKFASGKFQFPATLCLPKNLAGKAALVVLVHGSGPHDHDETIGPNKPFRDIAHALAASGIATLRYDKRTYAFAAQIDPLNFTLDEEVTDDAVAALNYAATLPEVDASRMFLLGHSLGGSMAPYIAQRYGKLRGLILLAAGARPIDQILADQGRMAMKEDGKSETEMEAILAEQKKGFARLRSGESKEPHAGVGAGYWRDWLLREPAVKLKELKLPVLVLQGGKDVQVLPADYQLLKTTLAARAGAAHEEHLFPELNHLFMAAKTGQVAEYAIAGQVDVRVTDAIAAWVKKQ